MAQTMHYLIGV